MMDIKRAIQLVNPSDGIREYKASPLKKEAWEILFKEYNRIHEKKLGLGCISCYGKVYVFMKKVTA